MMLPSFLSTIIRTYFPNLDELLFFTVLLLPKASKIGLQFRIFTSIGISSVYAGLSPILVSRDIANLAFSVLPAPLSPEITMA